MQNGMRYVLITAVRNEAGLIEHTLRAVMAQTVLPERWIIVDDGSTDGTAGVVRRVAAGQRWIELVSSPPRREGNFAGKANAVNMAFGRLQATEFDVVGNVDGDVSFDEEYMSFLLQRFAMFPQLGVAGTPFTEIGGYDSARDSFEGDQYVAGPVQLFRAECFRDIGGYVPNPAGGVDWIAVMTARMRGWGVRSFPDKRFHHHRTMGTAGRGRLAALFSYGQKDYYLGGLLLWQLCRVMYRAMKRPYLIGACALLAGYLWAAIKRVPRAVTPELMAYHRREQGVKLKKIAGRLLRLRSVDPFSVE